MNTDTETNANPGQERQAPPAVLPPAPAGPIKYGPPRPDTRHGYELFTTPNHLSGYSRKILRDLILAARIVSGKEIKLYFVDKSERCPVCMNVATGEKLLANCKVCHGTGYKNSWKYIGDFWTYVSFSQEYNIATRNGNVENPGGAKDQIIILGAPRIDDQSIIIFIESREVFKVYDVKPYIIAMRGDIIAQSAQASRLSPGYEEYKLIDW